MLLLLTQICMLILCTAQNNTKKAAPEAMISAFKALKKARNSYFEAKNMHLMAKRIEEESGLEMEAVLEWTTENIKQKNRVFRKTGKSYRKSDKKIYKKKKFSDRASCTTPTGPVFAKLREKYANTTPLFLKWDA